MLGASLSELALVAVLVAIVLLAQIAPRIGAAVGARFERPSGRAQPHPAAEPEPPEQRPPT